MINPPHVRKPNELTMRGAAHTVLNDIMKLIKVSFPDLSTRCSG